MAEGNETDNGVGGFADPGAGTTTNAGDATVTGGDGLSISSGQIGAGIGALAGSALGPIGSMAGGLAGRGIGNAIGGGINIGGFGQGPGGSTPNGGSPDSNDAGHGYGAAYGGGGAGGGYGGGGGTGGGTGGYEGGGGYIQNNAPLGTSDPNGGGTGAGGAPLSLTSLAQSDASQGTNNYNLGAAQYAWGQNQFNTVWPYAQQYLQSQINAGNSATGLANSNAALFNNYTAPTLQNFTNEANNYNSKAQADINAGGAMTDVANSFESARQNALANLESYGIDPSQTRFGALDLSSRIGQAAATAAAGTQSRLQTQATGMGLQGQAINAGMNLPSMANAGFNTGANVGSSGLAGANSTTTTGANIMGTPTQYSALGTGANSAGSNSLYQQGVLNNSANTLQFSKDQNNSSGIGSLIGGALGLGGSLLSSGGGGIGSFLSGI